MVLAQVQGLELDMARVLAVVHMQAVEVAAEAVAVANTVAPDLVVVPVPAQALVNIVRKHLMVMLVDILAQAAAVVAVVEDKQLEIIMDLVVMDLAKVLDTALVMQLNS